MSYFNYTVLTYRLTISGYSGTAGDGLWKHSDPRFVHNNMQFSTYDKDNDMAQTYSCSVTKKGAWWYNGCYASSLNGPYYTPGASNRAAEWIGIDTFKFITMKIKGEYTLKWLGLFMILIGFFSVALS